MKFFTAGGMSFLLFISILFSTTDALSQNGQVTVNSTSGTPYSVTVKITPTQILRSSTTCLNGYNYNVRFNYQITYSGTPQGNLYTHQVEIICLNNQVNGFYSLPKAATNSSGTAQTTTNPNVPNNGTPGQYSSPYVHCSAANIYTFNCLTAHLIIHGPGINSQTIPFNLGNPLPVELIEFNAEAEKNKVNLNWSTASERNSDYFTIERTTDGENFEEIGSIKASGNSSTLKSYQLTDYSPEPGISYYRLTQTDFDGQSESFEIKSVEVKSSQVITNVFPNPTADSKANVLVQKTYQLVELRLFNVFGQLILDKQIDASNGQVIETIELPQNAGTYLVELTQQGEVVGRHKLLVIH